MKLWGEYVPLREHLTLLRIAEERFQAERDRRYTEVNIEREKALKIKETADLAALQLAREIQTYKDEKANELREQISSERGHYASKDDLSNVADKLEATMKPVLEYMAGRQGREGGLSAYIGYAVAAVAVIGLVIKLVTG
jgi:Flp pilus assembly protein TadB